MMFYIMWKKMFPYDFSVDQLLDLLGPESVPALVEGINFVAGCPSSLACATPRASTTPMRSPWLSPGYPAMSSVKRATP
ncbi:MAG: hypothetical protein ACYC3I_03520 [Gemmataceae bacterium]